MPWPFYSWGKNPQYPLGSWVGLRAGLDAVAKRKIPFFSWEFNYGHPACRLQVANQ